MDTSSRSDFFRRWSGLFQDYDYWLKSNSLSAVEACIGFIKQFDSVSKIIVGIHSLAQLECIIEAMSCNEPLEVPFNLKSDEIDLIDPTKWRL